MCHHVQCLGTNSEAEYLFSHVDKDLGSWWEVFSKRRFTAMYTLIRKREFAIPMGFFNMIRKSFSYLLDIVKVMVKI